MLRILPLVLALLVAPVVAAETPASEAAIRELLKITDARNVVDGMLAQMDAMMKGTMQQAVRGQSLTPAEQRAIDSLTGKMMEMMKADMRWETLEPIYLKIYQKSFSQDEIDGMIAFYRTPVGAALIKKMPLVMQESMTAMQQMMGPMMQKIQKAVQESMAELIPAGKTP